MELINSELNHLQITHEFKNQLKTLLLGSDLELFTNFIFKQLSPLLSIAADLKKDSYFDINFYVNNDFGYKNMLKGGTVADAYFFSLLKFRKIDDNWFWFKSLAYSKLKRLQLRFNKSGNYFKFNENELMISFLNKKIPDFNLYAVLYNQNSQKVLKDYLISNISDLTKFYLNNINSNIDLENINSFIIQFISKIYTHINYLKNLKIKNISGFYTGTGGNYFNMLATYLGQINDIKIIRFAHGFERIFFNDDFWEYELKGASQYVNYSDMLNQPLKSKYGFKTSFIKCRSIYYQNLFESRFEFISKNKSKLLLIGQSYLGEARQLTQDKLLDINQFKIESKIIRALVASGLDIVYKPHPKGFANKKLLKNLFNVYFEERKLNQILKDFEFIFVTSISTAAIEAVLMGKKVIYLDVGIRPKSDYFEYLTKIIKCTKFNPEASISNIKSVLIKNMDDFNNQINLKIGYLIDFYKLFLN